MSEFILDNALTEKELRDAVETYKSELIKNRLDKKTNPNKEIDWNRFTNPKINGIPIGDWNVSRVNNMSGLFVNFNLFNADISNWDVSNVQNMEEMFEGCSNFNQPLNNWDISNVTNMSSMFNKCKTFNQPLDGWGPSLSKVTNMSGMFMDCTNFDQPLNNWDTSNVTDTSYMFVGCTIFKQPLNNWDTSNVTNMSGMFKGCANFNQPLDLWNVSKVHSMNSMFDGCAKFNQPLDTWNVSNVENMEEMFKDCADFNQPLNSWKVNNVFSMNSMFEGCTSFDQPFKWDISNIKYTQNMFEKSRMTKENKSTIFTYNEPKLEILKKYFNKTVYFIDYFYTNISNIENAIETYVIYYKTKNDSVNSRDMCIQFTINNKSKIIKFDNLKYSDYNVCKVTGAELLFLLFKFATEIGYNIENTYDISSKIFYVYPDECKIESLSKYNILLNGKTYYNKFGYGYGNGKVKNYEHLRSMTIQTYFEKSNPTYVEEIIEFFNSEEANITNDTVIKDFMAVIEHVIKKYESMSESDKKKEVLCKIAKYVNYIIEQSPEKIDFIAKDLLLDIKDPTTIELYKNLEKKIKLTTEVTGGRKTKRKKSRKLKRNTRQKKA